ncbi:MAG: YfhO family protein, partial [Lachnospiraceae bacterium]|nr:YfhO family protein [Lachnospiraceae bacterium]
VGIPLLECKDEQGGTVQSAADENSGSENAVMEDTGNDGTGSAKIEKKGIRDKLSRKKDKVRKARIHKVRKFPDLHLAQLGIGTLLSLALSSFIVIPQLKQMLSSARFSNGNKAEGGGIFGAYFAILKHVRGDYTTRWWTLLGLSFATALILTGIIRCRKNRRAVFMSVSMILMMVLELFFESINLIWHFGSYIQYPIRNGFIIYFVFAYWMCYFSGRLYDDETAKTNDKFYLSFIFTVIGFLAFVAFYRNRPGMQLRNVFHITSAIMAATFVFYFILLNYESLMRPLHIVRKKRNEEVERADADRRSNARYRYAAGVLACELLCFGFLLFGKPDFITGYAEEPEQDGEFIYICDQLREAFDLEPGFINRVKNPDESLNANYGFVLMQPALSNWTHMIAPQEQSAAVRWGYSIQFMRLLDAGGTVFSDALLGVKNVISCVPMDEELYEPVDTAVVTVDRKSGETAEYTLYHPKYTLPFVTVSGGDAVSEKTDITEEDIISLHNKTYHALTGTDEDIAFRYIDDETPAKHDAKFGSADIETRVTSDIKEVYVNMDISDDAALYLSGGKADRDSGNCTVEVNGNIIPVPTIKDAYNTSYPAHFNNNTLYLGCFGDEKVSVKVTMDLTNGDPFDVDIVGISLDAMDKVCGMYSGTAYDDIVAGNRELSFVVPDDGSAEGSRAALLPLTYDKGWKVKVNGKKVRASSYAGLFTRIPLKEGENTVTMKFTPPGMRFGIIISLAAFVTAAIYITVSFTKKKDSLAGFAAGTYPGLAKVYAVAVCIVAVFMYAVPIVYGICALIL